MKWIITGGAGFIGCHAAARFHGAGHRVVVVDNLSRRGADANLAWLREQGVRDFVKADVRDAQAMNDLMAEHADADAVLHLAGQVAVTTSVADPRADFEINALGTFNVLEAVRTAAGGRPAVLYSSTNKVYGNLEHVRVVERDGRYAYEDRPFGVDESEPLDFHSPYGCSKGAGDQYVRDYARIYGLKTVVFRQTCIYGTRQFGIEDQGWIAWFCVAATTRPAVHDLRRRQADPRRALGRRPDRRLRAGPGPDRRGLGRGVQHRRRPGQHAEPARAGGHAGAGVRPAARTRVRRLAARRPAGLRGRHPQGRAAPGLEARCFRR